MKTLTFVTRPCLSSGRNGTEPLVSVFAIFRVLLDECLGNVKMSR